MLLDLIPKSKTLRQNKVKQIKTFVGKAHKKITRTQILNFSYQMRKLKMNALLKPMKKVKSNKKNTLKKSKI